MSLPEAARLSVLWSGAAITCLAMDAAGFRGQRVTWLQMAVAFIMAAAMAQSVMCALLRVITRRHATL